ncbi:MAG: HDOD domain-containing protein [Sulfuricurvum sp.]|jgi:EAL and modified HD-GYP domain-containing signal transduction protein|uniref:EAL and HDOD domain-containing protein n=1 Tax=Sulfuricurvum sp. TaxID=2025608 RepID=UPI0025D3B6AF|nr:HDOD domain-containing protein [Sulfuricurvum sp.]MCI4406484.1 HDOD domain-containing protein [Sulfuricurvum sp.]
MGSSYIGRQPIVDQRGALVFYDLFSSIQNVNAQATATLINNLQTSFGIDRMLGKRVGLIRVDHRFIFHGLFALLPKERIIYSVLEDSVVDAALSLQLEKLKREGYRFALNDFAYTPENIAKFSPILPYLECVKIDIPRSPELSCDDIEFLYQKDLTVIGAKVETHEMHAECVSKGIKYFQGYFISKPKTIKNASFSVDHGAVVQLWNMLQSDADIDQLVKAFELNHMISLKLIRFINSAVFSLKNPVSSIRHVLTLMGRESLSRWIMMLLFSETQGSDENNIPLMLMVVNRTELMTQLLELIEPNATKSQKATAYFVGMLSLIHLLFNLPHREILRRLNVAPDIERALFEGDGFYGELLTMVRSIEMLDSEGIEVFLNKHALEYSVLEPLIASAMEKVNQFDEAMG